MQTAVDARLHTFLQGVFACTSDVATSIGRHVIDRRYPVRAIILRQGDRADAVFLLVTGRVHALTYGFEGRVVLLHEFLPRDFFGAIGHINPPPEEADLVAVEDVRAAAFLARDFLNLIDAYGCVGLAVSKTLLKLLRATAARMVERSTLSASGRVHGELLRMARQGDGWVIRPAPVLAALAVRVHSTRETVSRTISVLERRGIIKREGDALIIVAPHRLEEMVV